MKRYPLVHQLGFVVDDMEKAMDEYGRIYHIKKWYRTACRPEDDMFFHGRKISDPGFVLNIGYCGKTEIELITTAAEESLYANFLREHGPGLHHISFFTKNLDRDVEEMKRQGFEVVQNGVMTGPTTTTHYAYLARPGEGYSRIVEFSASKMFGIFRFVRGRHVTGFGCLTGDLTRVR